MVCLASANNDEKYWGNNKSNKISLSSSEGRACEDLRKIAHRHTCNADEFKYTYNLCEGINRSDVEQGPKLIQNKLLSVNLVILTGIYAADVVSDSAITENC